MALSTRQFHKSIIQVEVLSEEPLVYNSLEDIHYAITEGDCSGMHTLVRSEILDGAAAAKALLAQGSDPGFFLLTENGEDAEEDA